MELTIKGGDEKVAISNGRSRPELDRARERSERIPLGIQKLKLHAKPRPGYVQRWINDDGARVQLAQQGGYTFVSRHSDDPQADSTDIGDGISQIVGKTEGGVPMR